MILPADSANDWLTRHRAAAFPDHQPAVDGRPHTLLSTAELVDRTLESSVLTMTADGTPRAAAGMYLSGWYAGFAASFVAFTLMAADAGLRLRTDDLGWRRHPDGYPDALVVTDPRAVVLEGHPWSGQAGTVTVATRREQAELTVTSLVATADPIIDTLQRLTRAGRIGLWHEVSDAIGSMLAYQKIVPADLHSVALVRRLLDSSAAPWKRRPRIEVLDSEQGPVCVTHKGGCCLTYTEPHRGEPERDDDHDAFLRAFPHPAGTPDYCVSCKFRTFDESVRMQLWWRAREAGADA